MYYTVSLTDPICQTQCPVTCDERQCNNQGRTESYQRQSLIAKSQKKTQFTHKKAQFVK